MKLKELHIRNIASIESADIDFENGLNDAVTGTPAPIFLISGETGAGKSVILDGISMALYKKTPRIAGVANSKNNKYPDAKGETISVSSIEQYTRIGISERDECYSEVVFEGNDGRTYHARLSLGMMRSRGNETFKLKHRTPTWEYRIDDGDWIRDNTEQVLQQAVGLSFQQFGRMAMLAQGQFANFLTGDKKEREDILEQLTNTKHFSDYGEAISRLFNKAKTVKQQIQTSYETELPHTLSEEELGQLLEQQQESQQKKTTLDSRLALLDTQLRLLDQVLQGERILEESRKKVQQQEAIVAGEEYQCSKTLFTDWDATTQQRQQFLQLQHAREEEQTAHTGLQTLQETFLRLCADLAFRQNQLSSLAEEIRQLEGWMKQRQQHDTLYSRAHETEARIQQYLSARKKSGELTASLVKEHARTGGLRQHVEQALTQVSEAGQAVKAKEAEIDALRRKREAMDPQKVNDQLSKAESDRHALEILLEAWKTLQEEQQHAGQLRKEIEAVQEALQRDKALCDQATEDYNTKLAAADAAGKRLTTMQMSVSETIVNLRRRMYKEHTDICPLCGQPVDHALLDDDFQGILTPLEQEQQQAAAALQKASERLDALKKTYAGKQGALQERQKQLTLADQKNKATRERIIGQASEAKFDTHEPLDGQVSAALQKLDAEIGALQAAQREAERLQGEINRLTGEKKPLDTRKLEAEKAKVRADGELNANANEISRLEKECQRIAQECSEQEQAISYQLAGYAEDWKTDAEATLKNLRKEAEEYNRQKEQLREHLQRRTSDESRIATLTKHRQDILATCPEWPSEAQPQSFACEDIHVEWTDLLGKASAFVATLERCHADITRAEAFLGAYYQETGKTEQTLQALTTQEQQVVKARRFVTDIDARLHSFKDDIAAAQNRINAALQELGIADRTALPDKQKLEEERTSTNTARDEILGMLGQVKIRLEAHQQSAETLKKLKTQLDEAEQQFNRWKRLDSYFGGTRFRTLVQTYILRPLLNNANIYLERITDRYHLTCNETNEQLSILVHDHYNRNQIRSATVLSGGERFMISLALSLALSSLNRPDMNVNILFIDEGFGTLDESTLGSVMATLERLQEIAGQSNRRVGIISHRKELEEPVPVQIRVVRKGEGRSQVEIKNQY